MICKFDVDRADLEKHEHQTKHELMCWSQHERGAKPNEPALGPSGARQVILACSYCGQIAVIGTDK